MSPPLGAFNVWGTDMVFFIFLRDRVEKLQRSRTMSLSYPGSRWSGYRGSKKKISFLFVCAET